MITPPLIDYIRHQLKAGVGRENIKRTLLEHKWPVSDIEQAFGVVGPWVMPSEQRQADQKAPEAEEEKSPLGDLNLGRDYSLANLATPASRAAAKSASKPRAKRSFRGVKLFFKTLAITAVVLGVLAGAAYAAWTGYVVTTPQYSLYQMYETVEARDYQSFTRYADVDALAGSALVSAVESDNEEAKRQVAESFPELKDQIKTEIRRQVEAGTFGMEYKPASPWAYYTNVKGSTEDGTARLTIAAPDKPELPVRMKQQDGYWQLYYSEF